MGIVAELLVRSILITGLQELADDEVRFREIVARLDDLPQGSDVSWADDLWVAFRRIMKPDEPDAVNFKMGYPLEEGELPCVSIIKEAGAEDTGGAAAGDQLDVGYAQTGTYTYTSQSGAEVSTYENAEGVRVPVPRVEERTVVGTGFTTTVQVGSWTTSVELSLLLDACVHHVLFRDKGRLFAAGVQDVAFSEGGTPTEATMQAALRVGYVPMQRVTLEWVRRQTIRAPAPNRVRIEPIDPLV